MSLLFSESRKSRHIRRENSKAIAMIEQLKDQCLAFDSRSIPPYSKPVQNRKMLMVAKRSTWAVGMNGANRSRREFV